MEKYPENLVQQYSALRNEFNETDEVLFKILSSSNYILGKEVLDIGCGDGRHAMRYAQMGAQNVCGIDHNPTMHKLATDRLNGESHISFEIADGAHMSFKDASFDTIVSNYVFHYFKDTQKLFKEVSRVLKPGGNVVATFNVTDIESGFEHLYNTSMPIRLGTEVIVFNLMKSKVDIFNTIEKEGFDIIQQEILQHPNAQVDIAFEYAEKIQKIAMLLVLRKR